MTVGVRNWPRKPLSERERTIREALSRFVSTSSPGSIDVCNTVADLSFATTTPADVTDLSFLLSSGHYYQFRFMAVIQAPSFTTRSVVGIALSCTHPSATIYATNPTGTGMTWHDTGTASSNYIAIYEGIILPSADGILQLQAANTYSTASMTVKQGSSGTLVTLS